MAVAEEVATTHYVVRLVVERVDHMQKPASPVIHGDRPEPSGRKVTELADITVKSDELEKVVEKANAHLALVDDIEAIDPKRTTRRGTLNDRIDRVGRD